MATLFYPDIIFLTSGRNFGIHVDGCVVSSSSASMLLVFALILDASFSVASSSEHYFLDKGFTSMVDCKFFITAALGLVFAELVDSPC